MVGADGALCRDWRAVDRCGATGFWGAEAEILSERKRLEGESRCVHLYL